MEIKPINNEREGLPESVHAAARSVSSVAGANKPKEGQGSMGGEGFSPRSYRVDESPRRIVISLLDPETGKIIEQLSPRDAVTYVHHLNEAIRNMINEVA